MEFLSKSQRDSGKANGVFYFVAGDILEAPDEIVVRCRSKSGDTGHLRVPPIWLRIEGDLTTKAQAMIEAMAKL